jgi:hypothetical protein
LGRLKLVNPASVAGFEQAAVGRGRNPGYPVPVAQIRTRARSRMRLLSRMTGGKALQPRGMEHVRFGDPLRHQTVHYVDGYWGAVAKPLHSAQNDG